MLGNKRIGLKTAHAAALVCGLFLLSEQVALSKVMLPARADYAAPRPAKRQVADVPANSHTIRRADDGFFYVSATLNGVPIRFLVDTGASVAVLTESDARRVGAKPLAGEAPAKMGTAGGSVPMTWTNLDQLSLGTHDIRNVRAAIVSDDLAISLIGQNVLAKLSAIHIEGDEMRFE